MGRMVIAHVTTLCLTLGGGMAAAQDVRTVHNLPLELMELSLAADTVSGVQMLMQPSVRSEQGKEPDGLVWLRFHPDTVLEWINSAATALRTPVPNARADGIQWSRTLLPRDGKGGLSIGRERKKGKLQKQHWFAIADSTTGWRAELSGKEADSLLKLFLVVGTHSRLDTTSSPSSEIGPGDTPVSVLHQPVPDRSRKKSGRVVVTYVVGTDGLAEPESFVAFLASDPLLVPLAREMVRGSRYTPATRAGQPVRRLIQQVMVWRPGAPPRE